MNKTLVGIIGTCAIFAAAFTSCKKSKSSPQHDNVTGNWKKTAYAIDTNNNGVMDANEVLPIDSVSAKLIVVFNGDGSGQIITGNVTLNQFAWSLENNNTLLKLIYRDPAGKTTIQHIDNLTSSAMTLKDTSGISAIWDIFNKQ